MELRSHVIISVIFSTLFYLVFKSWTIAVSSFFSGVLIDCDHVFEDKEIWRFYTLEMKYGVSEGIRTPDPQDHNLVL
jgi:hypothetical protein